MSARNNQVVWEGRGVTWSLEVPSTPVFLSFKKIENATPGEYTWCPVLQSRWPAQRRENNTGNKTSWSWIRTLNISPSVFQASVLNVFPCGSKDVLFCFCFFFYSGAGTKYHWIKEASINQSTSKRFLISCLEQQNLQHIIFLMLSWRNSEKRILSVCSQMNTEIVFSRFL